LAAYALFWLGRKGSPRLSPIHCLTISGSSEEFKMFSGTFSIWHWLILLVIVIAIFGTKKLRGAGGDLGAAARSFKNAMREGQVEAARAGRPFDAIEDEA
jgi:sec-independent protein translocase protein TatA